MRDLLLWRLHGRSQRRHLKRRQVSLLNSFRWADNNNTQRTNAIHLPVGALHEDNMGDQCVGRRNILNSVYKTMTNFRAQNKRYVILFIFLGDNTVLLLVGLQTFRKTSVFKAKLL